MINSCLGTASAGWVVGIKHAGMRIIRMMTGTQMRGLGTRRMRCQLRPCYDSTRTHARQAVTKSTLAVWQSPERGLVGESSVLGTECAADAPGPLLCPPGPAITLGWAAQGSQPLRGAISSGTSSTPGTALQRSQLVGTVRPGGQG